MRGDRIGIVGGGPLGLTAAYRLAQRGYQVTVLEKDETVGGLSAGFPVGDSVLDRFYHHIFRTDRLIIDLIDELGLSVDLRWSSPNTSLFVRGRPYRLNSATSVLRFSPLSLIDRLRLGACVTYLKLQRDYTRFERTTAAAWIEKWMGRSAYEVVWRPQLVSKFGKNYDRIAMPWFWSRIHLRTTSLGYLLGSFQRLYDCLAERLTTLGGKVMLGEEVILIDRASGQRVKVESRSGQQVFDRVVCTAPSPVFIRITKGLSDEYLCQYDWGEHYWAHSVILMLDRPLSDVYWLSINDPGFPFLAVVEHTNFIPPEHYDGRHLVYCGNYLPVNHPLLGQSDAEALRSFLPHLQRINSQFSAEWVNESHIFKAPFAQPIVTLDYQYHLPPYHTPLPGLYLATMSQVYPQDRGQNYSIQKACEVAGVVAAT